MKRPRQVYVPESLSENSPSPPQMKEEQPAPEMKEERKSETIVFEINAKKGSRIFSKNFKIQSKTYKIWMNADQSANQIAREFYNAHPEIQDSQFTVKELRELLEESAMKILGITRKQAKGKITKQMLKDYYA